MADAGSPNADNIATWNDILVPKFLRFRRVLVDGFASHSRIPLEAMGVRLGEKVLDVGCGFGETTLDLAARVGDSGSALGIDCADGFIDIATADALESRRTNATFRVADAQTEPFDPMFDFAFSRFGTMFFQSPVAAMRNIRRSLRPGGRLLSIVWRTIDDNDWVGLPKAVARKHLPPPPDDGRSCGPGPFSMADPDGTREILTRAGFSNVLLTRVDAKVVVGRTLEEAVDFQLQVGPAGEIVREAGPLADEKRQGIEADLRAVLEQHLTRDGVLMGSSSWAITANVAT